MLVKLRGPLPVLVLAGVLVCAQAGVAAAAQSPRDVALEYAADNARDFGVTRADVADLAITSEYRSAHNGVTHVNVVQRHAGLEVFGGNATINVGRDGRVVFVGGRLVRGLEGTSSGAQLDAVEAVEAAADGLALDEPAGLRVLRAGAAPTRSSVVSEGGISAEPIPARLGYQPTKDGLRLAWQVTIDAAEEGHLWEATVDAADGDLLGKSDWSSHEKTPNPVNDGSSYRVFEFPKQDPNDGERTLVTNPADAFASPFGWHDTDGVVGPEFTNTQGNNAYAYSDRDNDNNPDPGSSPEGGPTLKFDFAADYVNDQPQSYVNATTTNLFYWCNMVHDLTYQYGFNEPSGNFQVNNYGKGGVGGDDVRCESQDGSGTNNANFSTPANDGGRPRMQMFLWPGDQFGQPNALTVNAPSAAAGTYGANYARFSPAPPVGGLNGPIVLVNDGTAPTADGCQPFTVPAGAIALVDNSTTPCNLSARTINAQNAGASAVVVAHNTAAAPPILNGSMNPPVTIPVVGIARDTGTAIKAALPAAGSVHRNTARPAMRDASFRAETIFHEYNHGTSLRLTGGPNINCLNGDEQAGEGWSDFFAIAFLMNPAIDDPNLPRGYGQWALYADSRIGPGFRAAPYSRNMALQPFTYDSIKSQGWLDGTSLALPHGLGSGWAAVLWDMTWDLVDKYGFNPNAYGKWDTGGNNRAIQYVMDGLKMQGCSPGLVVARAAIIASQQALTGGADTCTVWASFARRGLGYSAVQGGTGRNDNTEAFDTHPDCQRGFANVAAEPALTTIAAGSPYPMQFTADNNYRGLDIATKDNPYSRLVDCQTLKPVTPGTTRITPRPFPVPAVTRGGAPLSINADGVYTYPWQTDVAWGNSCREFVLTTKTGAQHRAFFKFLAATHSDGTVGGTVPATLSLSLGTPATFGAFAAGVARDYDASTAANVISTAGSATLSVADPSSTATGRLVNGAFALPSVLQANATSAAGTGGALANVGGSASPTALLNYANPIANDNVTVAFRQHIGANDALRTGTYSKTLTLTLSTTEP